MTIDLVFREPSYDQSSVRNISLLEDRGRTIVIFGCLVLAIDLLSTYLSDYRGLNYTFTLLRNEHISKELVNTPCW